MSSVMARIRAKIAEQKRIIAAQSNKSQNKNVDEAANQKFNKTLKLGDNEVLVLAETPPKLRARRFKRQLSVKTQGSTTVKHVSIRKNENINKLPSTTVNRPKDVLLVSPSQEFDLEGSDSESDSCNLSNKEEDDELLGGVDNVEKKELSSFDKIAESDFNEYANLSCSGKKEDYSTIDHMQSITVSNKSSIPTQSRSTRKVEQRRSTASKPIPLSNAFINKIDKDDFGDLVGSEEMKMTKENAKFASDISTIHLRSQNGNVEANRTQQGPETTKDENQSPNIVTDSMHFDPNKSSSLASDNWIDSEMRKADEKFSKMTSELALREREVADAQHALKAAKMRMKKAVQAHMAAVRNLELVASTLRHLIKTKHSLDSKQSVVKVNPTSAADESPEGIREKKKQILLGKLHDYAIQGNFRNFQAIFKKDSDLAQGCIDMVVPPHKQTLILIAARSNSLAIVEFLLSHGANPNIADKYGMTPLHLAARQGNTKMFHELLKAGGKPSSRNSDGLSPLDELQRKSPRMFQAHEKNSTAIKKIHAYESSRAMQLAEMLGLGIRLPAVPILSETYIQGMCIEGAAVEHHSSLLRSMLWKLLLSYLPWAPSRWEFSVFSHRVKYYALSAEFTPSWRCMDHESFNTTESGGRIESTATNSDYDSDKKLSPTSQLSVSDDVRFDDDATIELRRQIYVDLMRMRKDFPQEHRNAIARILFIFACMHPDISYVQGMHDVCAGLYFQFLNDNMCSGKFRTGSNSPLRDNISGDTQKNKMGTMSSHRKMKNVAPFEEVSNLSGTSCAQNDERYRLDDNNLYGVDLHNNEAIRMLLNNPDKMRRMIWSLDPKVNAEIMSNEELILRLKQVYSSHIACNEDMEKEGEVVDWDFLDAAFAAAETNKHEDDHINLSNENVGNKAPTGVYKLGTVLKKAAMRITGRSASLGTSKISSVAENASFGPAGQLSRRRGNSFSMRSRARSQSSVTGSEDGVNQTDVGFSAPRENLVIRLDHSMIRGKVERYWLSNSAFEVEADTFFCFRTLARRIRRLFHCKDGLDETLRFLQLAFAMLDKPLHKHLMSLTPPLTPTFYCLPWLLTLFSQGVEWPHVQRMWDAFLTHDGSSDNGLNVEFIVCFAIALARSLRSLLLQADFAGAMAILHGALGSLNFNSESVFIVARQSYKQLKKSNLSFKPKLDS